jgi:hypothetical protein
MDTYYVTVDHLTTRGHRVLLLFNRNLVPDRYEINSLWYSASSLALHRIHVLVS